MEDVRRQPDTEELTVYRPEWAAMLRALGHTYRIWIQRKHGSPVWRFRKGAAERDLVMLRARFDELQNETQRKVAAFRLTERGYRVVLDGEQQGQQS